MARGTLTRVDVPETEFGLHVSASGDDLLYDAGGPDMPQGVVRHNLATGTHRVVRIRKRGHGHRRDGPFEAVAT